MSDATSLTKDPKAIAQAYFEWLASDEGQARIKEAAQRRDEFMAKLRAARNIPWEKLHEPFTI